MLTAVVPERSSNLVRSHGVRQRISSDNPHPDPVCLELPLSSTEVCANVIVMIRTAECACRRVKVTVEKEPVAVLTCHCDFCQKRTGSVFQVSAVFSEDANVSITGTTQVYNGLEIDGSGTANGADVSYHFCPTCGSTVFWTFEGRAITVIAVGNFADQDFPIPVAELHTPFRHQWVSPIEGADQFEGFRPT